MISIARTGASALSRFSPSRMRTIGTTLFLASLLVIAVSLIGVTRPLTTTFTAEPITLSGVLEVGPKGALNLALDVPVRMPASGLMNLMGVPATYRWRLRLAFAPGWPIPRVWKAYRVVFATGRLHVTPSGALEMEVERLD